MNSFLFSLWLLIQTLSEDTHSQLKKNVYQNYGQFIETAKEISFLESEMYQLSHMITEQRNLLQSLAETSILGDKVITLGGFFPSLARKKTPFPLVF